MKSLAKSLLLFLVLSPALLAEDQPAKPEGPAKEAAPAVELNEAEKAFVELLSNAALVGRFSVQGRDDKTPAPEKYTIISAAKLGNDSWLVTARITYGKYDLPVPVPVTVKWAGDTAMIQVTDLTIPGMGSGFTSRVLFYGDRYAGTWQHGKVGGHMWGLIEKNKEESKPEEKPQGIPATQAPAPAK
jgi:hypothetical protein